MPVYQQQAAVQNLIGAFSTGQVSNKVINTVATVVAIFNHSLQSFL